MFYKSERKARALSAQHAQAVQSKKHLIKTLSSSITHIIKPLFPQWARLVEKSSTPLSAFREIHAVS